MSFDRSTTSTLPGVGGMATDVSAPAQRLSFTTAAPPAAAVALAQRRKRRSAAFAAIPISNKYELGPGWWKFGDTVSNVNYESGDGPRGCSSVTGPRDVRKYEGRGASTPTLTPLHVQAAFAINPLPPSARARARARATR